MTNELRAGWIRYTLQCPNIEEEGYKLLEAGAAGIEVLSADTVHCYVPLPHSDFEDAVHEQGFAVLGVEEVLQENWVQTCSDLFRPIHIGKVQIVPLQSAEHLPPRETRKDGEIYIIPGLGFGTGHHTATRLILELVQDVEVRPKRVLDLGTGSGILALLAHKLFKAPVDAIDVDPLALENAADNLSLNADEKSARVDIVLREGGVEKANGVYDLVLANLYAELLISMESEIRTHTSPGGVLIVSGIMSHLAPQLIETYAPQWDFQKQITRDGWFAAVVKRR